MSLVSYNGKYVSIGSKIADYVPPYLSLSAPLGYLAWDEYGQSCINTGNTITVYSNTTWTVNYVVGWLGGDTGGTGNGSCVVACDPDELGPGRGQNIIFSAPGVVDVDFGCTQLATGQTC